MPSNSTRRSTVVTTMHGSQERPGATQSPFAAVQGQLHLRVASGPVELSARVVRYGSGDHLRYSWHGDLRSHLHERGWLVLDDGSVLDVFIGRAFLRVLDTMPCDGSRGTRELAPVALGEHET